jgi:polysaccharide biosynthesis/export protein
MIQLAALFALLLSAATPAHAQSAADYVIGPEDVLTITMYDQTDLSGRYNVELDGTFSFPLIGRITAAGLTIRQFEADLRDRLADGYFKNPQLTVAVEQYRSQRIFVVGEVRQPGAVPLTGGMTLIEALARAGSTLPSASGEVVVVRPKDGRGSRSAPALAGNGGQVPEEGYDTWKVNIRELEGGDLDQNIGLRDGDTIFIPRAELIYIFGQVKNPGSYGIQRDTTVLQALSLAGGVTPNGAMGRIRIVRIVDGEKKELRVKLNDMVRPGDTIIVPERYF